MRDALRARGSVPILTVILGLTLTLAARARAASPPSLSPSIDRLDARASILTDQVEAARSAARRSARDLYRQSRGTEAAFAVSPADRAGRARSFDLTLRALRRDVGEARQLAAELERVRQERAALAGARVAGSEAPPPTAALAGRPPVPGPVVARFGVGKEPLSGVELRRTEIQILARAGDVVRPVAAGTVERVERTPAGSWVLVVSHAGRWTSVVSGLREVRVGPGDPVESRQVVGVVGRSPDGAPVVAVGIYRGRTAVDPGRVLFGRAR